MRATRRNMPPFFQPKIHKTIKNRQYNFSISAVTLIMSYLSDRRQCVWIGDQATEILSFSSGVVQGPLLFSLFINDITNAIESSHYHMYADDVQLYISCHSSEYAACVRRLNLDLDRIQKWPQRNSLSINASKSQAMVVNP
jgi:hypothetical protein